MNFYTLELYTNIWISIDATNSMLNKKDGEYKFHSISNERPAYRNADNHYLAYRLNAWFIMPEGKFEKGRHRWMVSHRFDRYYKNFFF